MQTETQTQRQPQCPGPAPATTPTAPTAPTPEGRHDVEELLRRARFAAHAWESFDQAHTDAIVRAAALAAADAARTLAVSAVEETRRGNVTDKEAKNLFAATTVAEDLLTQRTVGVIEVDEQRGLTHIAEPVGVVLALTPVTNPTSTAVFKSLLCLKTRNPVVFAFHPSAQHCSSEAARIVRDAAVSAGAPSDCIQWVEEPDMATTRELLASSEVSMVLATGGNAMVHAAYSSGHPAIGVGAGNVPAYIHASADVERAVGDVVASKTFDNGMICASEQAVIIDEAVWERAVSTFLDLGVHLTDSAETRALEELLFATHTGAAGVEEARLCPDVVGQSAPELAERAGFGVAPSTTVLASVVPGVGRSQPLSREKLCPVLAVIRVPGTREGIEAAGRMVELDGMGHTAVIHTEDAEVVDLFSARVRAVRILVNAPAALGAIGGLYNSLTPSLTLGCGAFGHTSVSDNVTAHHLLNVKHVARRRVPATPRT
ncbi:MAG: aldehyde dehydrogenase family protein [Pauljensenia sp.]